jgi:hypothetical protein
VTQFVSNSRFLAHVEPLAVNQQRFGCYRQDSARSGYVVASFGWNIQLVRKQREAAKRAEQGVCFLLAVGVISHVQADFADSRDSLHLPSIVHRLRPRLQGQGLLWCAVLADAAYANGFNYALLEERGITGWIPVFGQYKPQVEGFTYDMTTDTYTCPAGQPLPFQQYDTKADGGWLKIYWAAYRDCQQCPLKPTCAPTARRKQLTRTAYDPPYRRAWHRQPSRQGQRMRRLRQSTVEPVFGNLIHHYGLRRVNTRGQAGAHKTMLLAAVAYNLKKLLKHRPPQAAAMALALPHHEPVEAHWRGVRMRKWMNRKCRMTLGALSREPAFCNSHARFLKHPANSRLPSLSVGFRSYSCDPYHCSEDACISEG